MAAPVASKIVLPTDATNSGPKVQTQTEVIGADTVHAHFFVPRSRRKILGIYYFGSILQSVVQSAHNGGTTGLLWLQVPTAASIHARLRRLTITPTMSGEADMLSMPRIVATRGTFTGTASGAALTPAKRKTTDATPVADVRSASTGMTITVGGIAWEVLIPAWAITTSGAAWSAGPVQQFAPTDEEEFVDVEPGGVLSIYQPDAANASDTRRFIVSGCWDEYDNA